MCDPRQTSAFAPSVRHRTLPRNTPAPRSAYCAMDNTQLETGCARATTTVANPDKTTLLSVLRVARAELGAAPGATPGAEPGNRRQERAGKKAKAGARHPSSGAGLLDTSRVRLLDGRVKVGGSSARSRARQSPASESREKSQGRGQTPQQWGRTPRRQRSQTPRWQSRSKTRNRSKSRDQSHTSAQVSWAAMLKGSRPPPNQPIPLPPHPNLPIPTPHQNPKPFMRAKVLMNMLTRITSGVDRIKQQLMTPEIELKSPTAPPTQPEDAQQTIARLQETIARLQEQLRTATEKEQIETLKKARKTDVCSQPYVIPQDVNRPATYIQPATLNLHTATRTPNLDDGMPK